MSSFPRKPSKRSILCFLSAFLLIVLLYPRPIKNSSQNSSNTTQEKIKIRVQGSNLPDCQSSVDFLIFKDLAKSGGLLHKVEDFLQAMELAVRTNRTLVDFAPGLRYLHNTDVEGEKRTDQVRAWELFWTFGHFFDLEDIVYKVTINEEPQSCKFNFATKEKHQKLTADSVGSTLVLEFGERAKELPVGASRGRIDSEFLNGAKTSQVNWMAADVQPAFKGKPPFGKFIRDAAQMIKNECISKIQETSSLQNKVQSKFFVVQLRGSDREAVLALEIDDIISKIESFGITQQDYLYLMTDLSATHDYVKAIKSHFQSAMCQAKDMSLFKLAPFSRNNYIVFATELALQKISDGFIMTYDTHEGIAEENELGYLLPRWELRKLSQKLGKNFK